jgi:CheY-like chemotaxis protein
MLKLLIADDVAASRELIGTVLDGIGFEILEAADGQEALRIARAEKPSVIILDIQMPLMDGYEVLKEIRRDHEMAATPVIALTASAMQGERERALNAGFTAYVTKPISIAALRAEVKRLAGGPAQRAVGE